MRYLIFKKNDTEDSEIFSGIYDALVNSQRPIVGRDDLVKFDAACREFEKNADETDIEPKRCPHCLGALEARRTVLAPRFNEASTLVLEFEDRCFDYLKPRIADTGWRGARRKQAMSILIKVEEASTEEPRNGKKEKVT